MTAPRRSDDRPVLAFGEALWDVLADGARPGGAPLNVAVHLSRLGRRAVPISAVGSDPDGDRLLALIRDEQVELSGIRRHDALATGCVDVRFDDHGEVRYDIVEPVAWDEITVTPIAIELARNAAAIVFGTLAQRSPNNRRVLDALLALIPDDALRVFDVNLRPPHVDFDRLRELARDASLVKVNRAELARLVDDDDVERAARRLGGELDRAAICVTMGAEGAGMLSDGRWVCVAADDVAVVDPVGAGDAFVAGLVDGLLAGRPIDETLTRASSLAASVAGRAGAW